MIQVEIPGYKKLQIKHLVLDYNGTIANDGKLIKGVKSAINQLSKEIDVFVITADTFGTVEAELNDSNCCILKIGKEKQNEQKLALIKKLTPENTVSFGNGRNDELMLKESVLGVGILESEGMYSKNLVSANIVCKNILNAFELLLTPNKLIATLRN